MRCAVLLTIACTAACGGTTTPGPGIPISNGGRVGVEQVVQMSLCYLPTATSCPTPPANSDYWVDTLRLTWIDSSGNAAASFVALPGRMVCARFTPTLSGMRVVNRAVQLWSGPIVLQDTLLNAFLKNALGPYWTVTAFSDSANPGPRRLNVEFMGADSAA